MLFGSVWGGAMASGKSVYALEMSGGSVVDEDGRLMKLDDFRGVCPAEHGGYRCGDGKSCRMGCLVMIGRCFGVGGAL